MLFINKKISIIFKITDEYNLKTLKTRYKNITPY